MDGMHAMPERLHVSMARIHAFFPRIDPIHGRDSRATGTCEVHIFPHVLAIAVDLAICASARVSQHLQRDEPDAERQQDEHEW
jgi:hypothetical protein